MDETEDKAPETETPPPCPVCGRAMFEQAWQDGRFPVGWVKWACWDRDDAQHRAARLADLPPPGALSGGPPERS